MNPAAPLKVLILCTGNSARSIIGEYLLRVKGKGRFEVHSAGAKPTGRVNPLAVWVLKDRFNIDASDARSKSWDEFKDVKFDYVITVCDNAANETCPVLFGDFVKAHWGQPDPAAAQEAFRVAHALVLYRVTALLNLPVETMSRDALKQALDHIGTITDDGEEHA